MSKAEELLGIKYTELNPQQKKIYQNILKKESRKRNPESIKVNNKKYYEKQKHIITELKQQLSEKDNEIEELKEHIKFLKNKCLNEINVKLVNVTKEKMQEIRKQVCDMARKKIVEATCYDTEEEVRNVIYDLNASEALEILDQIEQGEQAKESMKWNK